MEKEPSRWKRLEIQIPITSSERKVGTFDSADESILRILGVRVRADFNRFGWLFRTIFQLGKCLWFRILLIRPQCFNYCHYCPLLFIIAHLIWTFNVKGCLHVAITSSSRSLFWRVIRWKDFVVRDWCISCSFGSVGDAVLFLETSASSCLFEQLLFHVSQGLVVGVWLLDGIPLWSHLLASSLWLVCRVKY